MCLRIPTHKSIKQHGNVTFESIGEMLYLDHVFQETIRMHPPVGGMTRKCTESIELTDYKDKNILIEKNTKVFIPIYSIHHNAEIYPEPEIFDPERFSESNGSVKKYKDLGAFLGFSDGSRICLGMLAPVGGIWINFKAIEG